jgi:hypothetical protein
MSRKSAGYINKTLEKELLAHKSRIKSFISD